jgi:phosphoglycerate dehydrogenase-like enzyme
MKVLIYTYEHLVLSEESRKRIETRLSKANANVVFVRNHQDAIQEVQDADVVFGRITPEMLKNAKRLKWVQAPVASMGLPTGEYYIFPELAESSVTLTSVSGIYNDVIADHVFAYITCFARSFPRLFRRQMEGIWDRDVECRILAGQTIGIIGLGGIGQEIARRAVPFGMEVIATRAHPEKPKPPSVKKVWGPEGLKYLLRESDFVVICLPHAPGTVHVIGREQLKEMKRTAHLINIGRGVNVHTDALVEALKNKEIAGAGLDVFEPPEPLPRDHPLWRMENVIITPHSAAIPTPPERRDNIFLDNFDRFVNGEKLVNVIDKKEMILA